MYDRFKNIISLVNLKVNSASKLFEVKNPVLKKIIPTALFLVFLHFFYNDIGVYKYINKRPCSIHSSAQCQRASVALNYYEHEMNFFKPMVQKDIVGDGITGLEFPIIYYTGAVFYKMFGFNEAYLKIISLLIFTFGLCMFNLLVLRFIKNYILSTAIVGSLICSTVLLYYSPNFMPDVPSFAFSLCAWYFMFRYLKTDKIKHLNWFLFFATMAALIKAIALIVFIIIICLVVLDYLKFFKTKEKPYVFVNKKALLLRVILGFGIVFSWYFYATWLSNHYHNVTFSLSPVIVTDMETAKKVLEVVKNFWLYQYYSYETYVFICGIILFLILCYRLVDRFLFSLTALYILGSVFYIYFFFNQFMWHDYYIIALFPCVFFLFVMFADVINKLSEKYFSLTKFILFVTIFFNVKECLRWTDKTYNDRFSAWSIDFFGNYRPYEDLEPKLRELGIKREDKTLFLFDKSFCNALYLSNQTGYSLDEFATKETLNQCLVYPSLKYLVVSDSTLFKKTYQMDIPGKYMSSYRTLLIYKLQ